LRQREWGFVATTNAGGANGWQPEFNEYFRGREVIIIPDYDEAGFARAQLIARGLLGIAARICVVIELTFRDRITKTSPIGSTKVIANWT
jgi:hypothetical protein